MKRYDEYKKSKVYWIKEIPSSWNQIKVSKIFSSIGSGTTPSSGDNTYYVDEGYNWLQSGDFKDNEIYNTQKKISEIAIKEYGLKKYPENSIVIAMYGASIGKVGFLKIPTTVNQACCVLSDSNLINIKYAFYSFIAEKNNLISKSRGGTQPNISQEIIKNHYLALPPLSEQEKIVEYLENKTQKIDAYISDKKREIQLLGELKEAEVANVVTRGIDPNAKMKDSKNSLFGAIPSHWDEMKLKYCFTERVEKNHPNEPILCATQSQGVIPQSMYQNRVVVVNKGFEGLKFVKVGDFVISLRSFEGGIEYAYYQGIISAAYTILTPKNKHNTDYFKLLFKSKPFIHVLQTCVTGIREGQNINYQVLGRKIIPLPPLEEQQAIVAYIEEKCKKIDALVEALEAEIEQLKEYKQSLIADCVTGKIKM